MPVVSFNHVAIITRLPSKLAVFACQILILLPGHGSASGSVMSSPKYLRVFKSTLYCKLEHCQSMIRSNISLYLSHYVILNCVCLFFFLSMTGLLKSVVSPVSLWLHCVCLMSSLCLPHVLPVFASCPPCVCLMSSLCLPHVLPVFASCPPCVCLMSSLCLPHVLPVFASCPPCVCLMSSLCLSHYVLNQSINQSEFILLLSYSVVTGTVINNFI